MAALSASPQLRRGRGRPPKPQHLRASGPLPLSEEGHFVATVLPTTLRKNDIDQIHLVVYQGHIHFVQRQYKLLNKIKLGCRSFKCTKIPRISLRRELQSKCEHLLGAVQHILPLTFLEQELATERPTAPPNGKVIDWAERDAYLLEFYRFLNTCTIDADGTGITPHYDAYTSLPRNTTTASSSSFPQLATSSIGLPITCARELLLMHRTPSRHHQRHMDIEEIVLSNGMVPLSPLSQSSTQSTTPPSSPTLPPLLPPPQPDLLQTTNDWKGFSLTMLDHVGMLHSILKRTIEFNDTIAAASSSSTFQCKRQRLDGPI